jgi:ABC-2 type transport system ATP-binding protein
MGKVSIVRTENLTKEFKDKSIFHLRRSVKALDNLNLEVEQGEIFGYLGPNGAGKTTTFKLLLGLIFPTSGKAWVLGKSVGDVDYKRYVGFLPEQPYFYDYLTGGEFLDFYAKLFRIDSKTRKQKVSKLLEMVGLSDSASTQLRKFSRGMLQRIGIAQALINDPEFVILDEPLSGLDPVGRKQIRDIIFNLKREGRTVVFSSHILSDVESICDRVAILMRGKLQFVQRLDELLNVQVESVEIAVIGLNDVGRENIESLCGKTIYSGDKTIITVNGINSHDGEQIIAKVLGIVRDFGGKVISIMSRTQSLENLFVGLNNEIKEYSSEEGTTEVYSKTIL